MSRWKKAASRSLLGGVLALAVVGVVENSASASVTNSPGYFHFMNDQSRLCGDLGATTQDPLRQHGCHNTTVEEWRWNKVGTNTYQLVNHASGECATLQEQSGLNGDTVGEAPCAATLAQYWSLIAGDDTAARWIQNREFNQCMQIPNGDTVDLDPLQVYQCNFGSSGRNQIWWPVNANWAGA